VKKNGNYSKKEWIEKFGLRKIYCRCLYLRKFKTKKEQVCEKERGGEIYRERGRNIFCGFVPLN
jgi:hypothetical protein